MGGALARGFAKAGLCPAEHITLAAPHESTLGRFAEAGFATTTDNKAAVAGADVVIVAVKPWLVGGVIDEVRPALDCGRQTVVSVAAGVSGDELKAMLSADGGDMPATFIAMARQGVFFIPLVWILTLSPLGLLGIQMSQSVSDLLTLAVAIPTQLYVLRQMARMQPAKV